MQFTRLFFLTSFTFFGFQAYAMELTYPDKPKVIVAEHEETRKLNKIKEIITKNNDPILLEHIGNLYFIKYFTEQIDNLQNLKDLKKIRDEVIKIAAHFKHIHQKIDISDFKKKYDARKIEILINIQSHYELFMKIFNKERLKLGEVEIHCDNLLEEIYYDIYASPLSYALLNTLNADNPNYSKKVHDAALIAFKMLIENFDVEKLVSDALHKNIRSPFENWFWQVRQTQLEEKIRLVSGKQESQLCIIQ